jgi:hypothetical protein
MSGAKAPGIVVLKGTTAAQPEVERRFFAK